LTKATGSKANFVVWIGEVRRNPSIAISGLAGVSAYLALTSTLDGAYAKRHPVFNEWIPVAHQVYFLLGLLGMALLIWLMGSLKAPRSRTVAFIFWFFGGAILTALVMGVADMISIYS
jgi:hypothetical protein